MKQKEDEKPRRTANALRESARQRIDALAQGVKLTPDELRRLFSDLTEYHDRLDDRDRSMQSAVTELLDGVSETSRNLAEADTRLGAIFQAAEDVAFIISGTEIPHDILEFSAGAERILGYDRGEILGKPLSILCPEKTDLPKGEPWVCGQEYQSKARTLLQRKDGKDFPAQVSNYPLKDSNGNPIATLTIAIDVTKIERAEHYLKESNERYEALALTVPASIIAFGKTGTITFVNNWHLQVIDRGSTQPELYIGKKIYELAPVIRAGIDKAVKRILDGIPISMEDVYFPPFGEREAVWHNIRLAPLMVSGEFHGGILILEDVTRRKHTELDLKMLIDSSPIPLIKAEKTPEESIIRYLNPEAVAMLGHGALGKPLSNFIKTVPQAEPSTSMHGEQCEVKARDGVRQAVRTMHEASGKFEIHAVMDVDELIHAKEAAEDASRAKSDFLANISHEIRTPLNILLGMLQLFQDKDLGEELNEMSSYAMGAGNALLVLLNDILDFSVVESRALALDEHPFNLREVMELVILPYSMEATNKGLQLDYTIDENMPDNLFGDARRLRQILFHVIGNAVKFTDEGSVTVEATFLPHTQKDARAQIAIMVTDTGIGMTDEQIRNIYEPFHQLDGSRTRRHGGTGIGLALVHEFVTAMGGSISARSHPGEGAEFLFTVNIDILNETNPA